MSAVNDNFLLFYEEETSDTPSDDISSPLKSLPISTDWNIKESNKRNHPTKKQKKIQQLKHGIDISESPSSSISISIDNEKENNPVSFIISNSRTNISNNKSKSYKDLLIDNDSSKSTSSLPNSPSIEVLSSSSSLPFDDDNNNGLYKNNIHNKTNKESSICVINSLSVSGEDFPSWNCNIDSIDSSSDSINSKNQKQSKELLENTSSECEINKVQSISSPLFVDTQDNNITNTPIDNINTNIQVSISEENETSSSSSIKEIVKQNKKTKKKISNRKQVLENIDKRTSPSPPKKKLKILKNIVGKKRKRKQIQKSESIIENNLLPPLKRQKRTYSQTTPIKINYEDSLSSTEDTSDITNSKEEDSLSECINITLSSNLKHIIQKKSQEKIFKGFSFVLTGIDTQGLSKQISKLFPSCLLLVDLIKKLIQIHGGKIKTTYNVNTFHRLSHKEYSHLSNSILISSDTKRTEKYLLGIVYGTPTLSYKWIIDCCEKQSIIDFENKNLRKKYQLPAGISKKGNLVYLWETLDHPKNFEYPPNIFNELRCEVEGSSIFKTHWSKILRAAGAKVVTRLGSEWESKGRGLELVISEEPVSQWVKIKCKKLRIPICSKDYIIECILYRTKVSKKQFKL